MTVIYHEVVRDEHDMRLDRWFKQHYPSLSFGQLQKKIRKGEIRLDKKRIKHDARLQRGQVLRIPPFGQDGQVFKKKEAAPLTQKESQQIQAMVLGDNAFLYALNKPAGLAVQGGTKTYHHVDHLLAGLVGRQTKEGEQAPVLEKPRLVHRLDRDTSGILIVAKTRQAAISLTQAFSSRAVQKTYWAIIVGIPPQDESFIDLPLSKGGMQGKERSFIDKEHGKEAQTYLRVLAKNVKMGVTLVELSPKTGRTHQLRAHMEAIGCPVAGDRKYGTREKQDYFADFNVADGLYLHAKRLELPKPFGIWQAPLSKSFEETLTYFGLRGALPRLGA